MNRISWMFMAVVEIILFLVLAKAIYGENIKIEKTKAIYFTILVIVFFIIESIYKVHIAYFLIILSVIVFSEGSVVKRILNSLIVLVIAMGIQEFITLSVNTYSLKVYEIRMQLSDVIYIIVMLMISWLIKYLRENFRVSWRNIPSYIYINIVLGFSAGIIPLNLIRLVEINASRLKGLIVVVSYLAILLNLFSMYLFIKNYQEKNKYGQESKEKSELMKVQAQYLENTVKNYEYLRKFRHDMRGHIRILKTMCEDNPEALSYIEKMGEKINSTDVFKCSNSLVSAVLNTFGNELNDEGVHHDIHYFVNGDITMDDLELCSLLYNLTNNALEAERKVDKEYRKIEVDIRGADNHLFIIVKNDVSEDFNMDSITKKETTKNDKAHHGIGLHNIEDIVDKYDGYVDYSCKDGRIIAEVLLQDVVSRRMKK